MSATYEVAIDEMFAQFSSRWGVSAAIVGYVPEVRWPGIEVAAKPAGDKFWVRVSQQTVKEVQTSLSACIESKEDGTASASRFTAYGLIFVQLFCPKSDALGMEKGRALANLARSAYRGKKTANGVVFRNVRINELDGEELWHRFNVVAETEYDEVT